MAAPLRQVPDKDLAQAQKEWSPGQSVTPKMPCRHGVSHTWDRPCKDCKRGELHCKVCGHKELHHELFEGLCPPKGWKP